MEFLLVFMSALSEAVASLPPAPEQPLTQPGQTAATGAATNVELARPVHIPAFVTGPDPAVFDSFKTEFVLFDDPNRGTIELNFWSDGDPRDVPHTHPWLGKRNGKARVAFISTILRGGYTEKVTSPNGVETIRTFRAGDKNTTMSDEAHVVYDVQPNTVTLMVCSPRRDVHQDGSRWGYIVDGKYVDNASPAFADPTFFARFCLLNPFRRPAPAWAEGLPAGLRRQT